MSQPRATTRPSSASSTKSSKTISAYDENKIREIEGRLLAKMENVITTAVSSSLEYFL